MGPIFTPPPSPWASTSITSGCCVEFQSRGNLLRAFYYTAVIEDQEYSSIRPLIDWLDYNGYSVVTKATKEFVDQTGRRKVKGNMDIELAVDAMELAPHIDHMVLFSGDGDFRSLVEAVQRRGVRVTVISTISTQPPMVADELRRQADIFTDIVAAAPTDRPRPVRAAGARPLARAARRASAHAAVPAARPGAGAGRPAPTTISRIDRAVSLSAQFPVMAGENHQTGPQLPALPAARGIPRGLARARAVVVQRAGALVRAGRRAAADRRPCAGPARRQPHRAAVHRRLRRRSALRHAEGIRLRPRHLRGARPTTRLSLSMRASPTACAACRRKTSRRRRRSTPAANSSFPPSPRCATCAPSSRSAASRMKRR